MVLPIRLRQTRAVGVAILYRSKIENFASGNETSTFLHPAFMLCLDSGCLGSYCLLTISIVVKSFSWSFRQFLNMKACLEHFQTVIHLYLNMRTQVFQIDFSCHKDENIKFLALLVFLKICLLVRKQICNGYTREK